MLIEINVTKKRPVAKKEYKIVCGNSGYKVSFTFDSEWDAYELKTARFRFTQDGVKKHIDVVFEGNECEVPILTQTALVKIGVFAGNLRTTTPCSIFCEKSIVCDSGVPDEPPSDVYNQLLEKCDEAVKTANEANERSKEAKDGVDNTLDEINTALEETNEAIQNANTAASNVHSGIEAAISAANAAYGATDTAYSAATTAFDAATDAKESTRNANDAADRATSVIDAMPNTFANALKGSASGEIVGITDISPIMHNVAVKAASKNLLPYPYLKTSAVTSNGVTITPNEDGSIHVKGTSTATSYLKLFDSVDLKDGVTYTICDNSDNWAVYFAYLDETGTQRSPGGGSSTNVTSFIWKEGYEQLGVYIQMLAGKTVDETIYPMLCEGSYSTLPAWTPYVPDVSAATVKVLGKNLFIENTDNWSIYYASDKNRYGFAIPSGLTKVTLSAVLKSGYESVQVNMALYIDNGDGTYTQKSGKVFSGSKTEQVYQLEASKKYIFICLSSTTPSTIASLIDAYHWQLEIGDATPYEPYIEPTSYPIAADGTVEGVTSIYPNMTITTDTQGVKVDAVYNRDINKAFAELQQALISLGGNI